MKPMQLSLRTLLVLLLVLPVICAIPYSFRSVPGAILEKIEAGMTQSEVEVIAGKPNSAWSSGEGEVWEYHIREFGWSAFLNPQMVEFDASGRVVRTWVQ
jgi:hypothetical protein